MRARSSILLASLATALAGCAAVADDDTELASDEAEAESTRLPLRFLPGEQFVPTAQLQVERRLVFRTEAELETALQMDNPGIDFSREWGVFYAPGNPALQPGSQARIEYVSLSLTGLTLKVTTALEHNGAGCPTRHTRPFLFVAIPIPDEPPPYTRFYRADRTRDCSWATYYDGVPFTPEQAAGALAAANAASAAQLDGAGIAGTQRNILLDGRPWGSLAQVADTPNIGALTMERLRALGAAF